MEALQEEHIEEKGQPGSSEGAGEVVEMTEAQVEKTTEAALALEAMLDISTIMTNAGIEAAEIIKVLEQFMPPIDSESSQ